jgi:hypothetical protein
MFNIRQYFGQSMMGRGHWLGNDQVTAIWFVIISACVVLGPQRPGTWLRITMQRILVAPDAVQAALGGLRRLQDLKCPAVSRLAG